MDKVKELLKNKWVQGAIGITVLAIAIPPLMGTSIRKLTAKAGNFIGDGLGITDNQDKHKETDTEGTNLGYTSSRLSELKAKTNNLAKHLGIGFIEWWPWEDEELVCEELMDVNITEFSLICKYYNEEYDRDLKKDIFRYLNKDERKPIEHLLK